MLILVVLIVFALVALIIVSAINRAQEKDRVRRLQQRRLKLQVDAFNEIVATLEQTVPNKIIALHINDEVIKLLRSILLLETGRTLHIESSIRHAQLYSEELMSGKNQTVACYQKESDTKITQTQLHLTDAGKILSHLSSQGKFSENELGIYLAELTWAYLMVSVASYIAQAYKFSALDDQLLADGFFQKAHQLLLESTHPEPRRIRMIKELSEILSGTRKRLSKDLLPELSSSDQAVNL